MSKLSAEFRKLHTLDDVLILPNAWDAGSARIIEAAGAKAIATSSAGVSWAFGYPDGDALPATLLADLTARITDVIRVPLTVDVEGAYTNDIKEIGDNLKPIFAAGAVGINIEDGNGSPEILAKKITEARRAAKHLGVDVFINARTDVYWRAIGDSETRVAETIRRGKIYREAGADGFFVPALCESGAIQSIVAEVQLPLNVLTRLDLPSATELKKLGVHRLSSGSAIAKIIWNQVEELAKSFLATGDSRLMTETHSTYDKFQDLFNR